MNILAENYLSMPVKPSKINAFLFFKLPAAFFCGVRVKSISDTTCVTSVKHRWINQNPFKSMFWAVQGMAAELSTGALLISIVRERKINISMLIANNKASFSKRPADGLCSPVMKDTILKRLLKRQLLLGKDRPAG